MQSGIRQSSGEGNCRTPLHGVGAGGKPRPRRKLLEVFGAMGHKQTVSGIGATDSRNSRLREQRRADNRHKDILDIIYMLVYNTGLLCDDCDKWDNKKRDKKT